MDIPRLPTPDEKLSSFLQAVDDLDEAICDNSKKTQLKEAIEQLANDKNLSKFSDTVDNIFDYDPPRLIVESIINPVGNFYRR